jgi:hypothetical protein
MERIVDDFECLHDIPFIVNVLNGFHIPTIAPNLHIHDHYNHKGSHSILL